MKNIFFASFMLVLLSTNLKASDTQGDLPQEKGFFVGSIWIPLIEPAIKKEDMIEAITIDSCEETYEYPAFYYPDELGARVGDIWYPSLSFKDASTHCFNYFNASPEEKGVILVLYNTYGQNPRHISYPITQIIHKSTKKQK